MQNSHAPKNLYDTYNQMVLGKMVDGQFTTKESDTEIVECFVKVAGTMPNCAAVYAQTAIFGNVANVLHFVRPGKTICVKLVPTSKIHVNLSESARAIIIDMKGVVVKQINDDKTRTNDELVDSLTIQLQLSQH